MASAESLVSRSLTPVQQKGVGLQQCYPAGGNINSCMKLWFVYLFIYF